MLETLIKPEIKTPSFYKSKLGINARCTLIDQEYILRIFPNGFSFLKLENYTEEAQEIIRNHEKCSLHDVIGMYDKVNAEISEMVEKLNPFRGKNVNTVKITGFSYGKFGLSVNLLKSGFDLDLDEDDFGVWLLDNEDDHIPVEFLAKDKDAMTRALEDYLTYKFN